MYNFIKCERDEVFIKSIGYSWEVTKKRHGKLLPELLILCSNCSDVASYICYRYNTTGLALCDKCFLSSSRNL